MQAKIEVEWIAKERSDYLCFLRLFGTFLSVKVGTWDGLSDSA